MTSPRSAALHELIEREQREFARLHPGSLRAYNEGQKHFLYGAPSHWMRRWAGGFPLYFKSARGAHFECVDGLHYVDFCLGDSGAMCGHGPRGRDECGGGSARARRDPDAADRGGNVGRR